MRLATTVLFTLMLAGCSTPAAIVDTPDPNLLTGTWKVDLRPMPDAEAYYQELVVTEVNGGVFSGTLYGSPVTQARINADWGKVRIAFVTEDQSGPYHHSAVLNGTVLEGLSNATGRKFLSYWSARKE